MKKFAILSLSLALCVGMMSGCTSEKPAPSSAPSPSDSAPVKVEYPTKPVTVIVPDKAGGSSDLLARLTFAEVEKKLGQSFSIVNKEGAGGQLGMIDVAEAAADGYTIGYLTDFSTAAAFASGDDIGYQVEDLEFVCSITAGTNIIVVGPSYKGERSVAGLVEYAKENPGKLTVGVAASGQAQVLKSFMEKADIEMTQVMFNSGNESYTSLVGEHIDVAILGTKFDKQCAEQGGTSIAVTSHVRFSLLPDVPTLLESGYDVLNNEVSRSFVVPKGTPQEVIDLLASTILDVTDNDEFKETLANSNEMYLYRDGKEAKAIYDQKLEQLKELVEQ